MIDTRPPLHFTRDGHFLLLRMTHDGFRASLRCDQIGNCEGAGGYCWLREWLECAGLDEFLEWTPKGVWTLPITGPVEIEWHTTDPEDGDLTWRPVCSSV